MRLLLAEDERELSRALTTVLERSGYGVDAVFDGQDALDYLRTGIYDGAILDIMMPKLDGLSVLRQLRREGNPVPVLLLTAKSEIDDRVAGLDSGADDYLTKPFAMKELLARIRAMTRRQVGAPDVVLAVGNLRLDRRTFVLSTESGFFRLANREFQIMELLMSSPGQVFSADHLLEKIWGWDSEAEASVVWVYLSYLRKKLAALNANVRIRAARNLGYCLEVEHDT